jgi:hypothetical protein
MAEYNFKDMGDGKYMKKALFVLFAVLFVNSMCFADEEAVLDSADDNANSSKASNNTAAPAQVSSATVVPTQLPGTAISPVTAGTTNFTGTVDITYSGDSMSETNPQITVKDDNGQGTNFVVASDATIIDKDGNPTNLDWIDNGDKVSIEYIAEQDGTTKTVKSIKVLPD